MENGDGLASLPSSCRSVTGPNFHSKNVRVEPELFDHPKYLRLKKRLETPPISHKTPPLECLLRLWGHCQCSQRGGMWRKTDPEYVELVARWDGTPGLFFDVACEVGFIDKRADFIVIHDWDKFNSRTRQSWQNGKLGGRPQAKPKPNKQHLGLTQAKPNSNPEEPVANAYESMNECMSEGKYNKGEADSRTQFGAIQSQIERLEKMASRTEKQVERLKELRRVRALLQKKQEAGDFSKLTKAEMEQKNE